MKRIAGILLLALVVVGLCASGAQASPSRGANCASCHMSASAGSDRTVNGGAAVTLDGSNSGYDQSSNTINSYAWTQTAGTPAVTLTGANTSRATFAAPTVSAQARLTFQLAVTDLVANVTTTKTDTVVITVNPSSTANRPPVANAGADRAVTAGGGVTLSGSTSSDPDGGTLTYAWAQSAGTGVSLANAGTVSATFAAPNVSAATPLTFQLTVRDSGNLTSTDTVVITVNPASTTNRPPVANAGVDRAVNAGAAVTLSGSGSSDPDGGTLSYAWAQTVGTGVSLANAGTVSASFPAPNVSTSTAFTFRLTVRDSGNLSSTDTVVITVNPAGTPANRPPTASAGLDLGVLPGTLNTLDGFYSSDPDDGIATYAWTQTGGPAVALSNPAASGPIFQAPTSPTTLTFRLLVADNGGLQDDDTVTVVVLSSTGGTTPPPPPTVNRPPVANAGPDQSVRSRATVRLTGAASRDPDAGDAIGSYRWRQTGGTSVRLSSTSSVSPSFTAPSVSRSTTLTFQLTVTDRAGLTATDTVRITVSRSGGDDEEDDD